MCQCKKWKQLDPDVLSWIFESDWHAETLWHLTDLRLVVEPAAAEWATLRVNPDERAYIEECFRQLETAVGDRDAWIEADEKYHGSILMACHNDLIEHLVSTLRSVLQRCREATILVMELADAVDRGK